MSGDEGMVSAFLLAAMIGLFAVVGLGLDPGEAYAAKIKAIGQAEEAARAGAQQLDLLTYRATGVLQLDPVAAEQAAQRFLTAEGQSGTVIATTTRVTVTITTSYRTQLWHLAGIDTIAVHATGTAIPQRGITGPDNP
ncbi:hypothetical protein [Jatrophihabitans lederbergiae]|uniref:Flp pilus-assembly TadG-like N-terminal domain-containing protein n=1 Tax=Jatrophihabitans lederbergiae TaxID=3075547 RepID=A0ABU2JF54_9ACTN|nr:hypothetical protein [Jatrophihabitans sp. DSM 44399]MDT0263606.1 hypothetical protein [Jatrophihabitans sp. DSM 44399]